MEERSHIQLLRVAGDVGFSSLSARRLAAFPRGFENQGRLSTEGELGGREDLATVSKMSTQRCLRGLGVQLRACGIPLWSQFPSGPQGRGVW